MNNIENIDFEIEIVDAYDITPKFIADLPKEELTKTKQRRIGWSVHVYIGALDQDLRGILARKTTHDWFIVMPSSENYDKQEKRWIKFPCVSFTNPKKQAELIRQVKEKFTIFIKEKLIEEQEEKEKKQIAWAERQAKNKEKSGKMSEKRNEKEKYSTQFKTKSQVKK